MNSRIWKSRLLLVGLLLWTGTALARGQGPMIANTRQQRRGNSWERTTKPVKDLIAGVEVPVSAACATTGLEHSTEG
jgi:hypothetical protein